MSHLYLKKLGIDINKHALVNWKNDKKKSKKKFKKERKIYGFDSRETYSLDATSAYWLYEHLKMFYEISKKIVDLSYHKNNISVLIDYDMVKNEPIYKIEEHNTEECILLMIKYLEDYITYDGSDREYVSALKPVFEKKKKYTKMKFVKADGTEATDEELKKDANNMLYSDMLNVAKAQTAFRIYGEILPTMWW